MPGRDIIETKKLVKKFGEFVALDDVDPNVKEGEVSGLPGLNSAGKTTIIVKG